MKRFVHRRIIAGVVGDQSVFFETLPHVVAVGREGHVHTPAQIAKHRTAIALDRGNNLHLAAMMQLSAVRFRPQYTGEIIDAARRKIETLRRGCESGCVGNRGHFNRTLGAIEK